MHYKNFNYYRSGEQYFVRMEKKHYKEILRMAKRLNMSPSAFIREAIKESFKKYLIWW